MTANRLPDIEHLFHDIRELPPDERQARLAEIARSDPDLASEVALLFAELPDSLVDRSLATLVTGLLPAERPRLSAGQSVGHYRVSELIGAGSMGEVYRAHDTSLGRDVAIKLLPEDVRDDPERLARFEREARLLATLNHPHVATIHGLVEADGVRGLVLELIEGPTLADRLRDGALPCADALRLARQIVAALDAIHSHGVVHRDLKPANVKLSDSEFVKVIDFGIGKSLLPVSGGAARPMSAGDTTSGAILGTPAYMSPEQASGGGVDKRADIWAFGCVLFEMLSGTRAFPGEDARDALAAVLGHDPDWQRLPSTTPAAIHRLLRRCLEKNPAQRLRDIGDALPEIDGALDPDRASREPRPRRRWQVALLVGTLALAGGIAVGWLAGAARSPLSGPAPGVQRFSLVLPQATERGGFALSPDGTAIVYESQRQLYLERLDDARPRLLPGTADAVNPFFSPDSQWIGFVTAPRGQGFIARRGQLKKVSVQGGAPVTLTDAVALGGSWGADGRIVFAGVVGESVGLFSIAASGGPRRPLTAPTHGGVRDGWPHHLPDGQTILFSETETPTFDSARIMALPPAGTPRTVIDVGYGARYLPSGHLVYLLDGNLMAVSFNPARSDPTGIAVRVLMDVQTAHIDGSSSFSVARNGLMVYGAASVTPQRERSLVWVTAEGRETTALKERDEYSYPRLSPDGRRLAVGVSADISVLDLTRGTRSRIAATDRGTNPAPPITTWSTDGRHLTFNRRSPPVVRLESADPDDLEATTLLLTRPYLLAPGSWSRQGTLVFFQIAGNRQRDLAVLEPSAHGEARPWLESRYNERGPVFSPDGTGIAYVSDASGRDEVYVRPYPGPGAAQQVSVDGGTEPVWSRDGRDLFFRSGTAMVAVSGAGTRALGRPRVLFERPYATSVLGVANYDVGADRRFLMIAEPDSSRSQTLTVVEHWFEELARLVPID